MSDEIKEPIPVNPINSTMRVPHLGITLRTLFGAALSSAWADPHPGEKRDFTVVHKGVPIATIHVKQHDAKPNLKEETCA